MGQEPNEIEGAGESGACLSSNEAEVRVRKSSLSRTEEERPSVVCYLRLGQPVRKPEETAAERGVVAWRRVSRLRRHENISQSLTDPGSTRDFLSTKKVPQLEAVLIQSVPRVCALPSQRI